MGLLRRKKNDGFSGGFSLSRFVTAPFRFIFSFFAPSDQGLGEKASFPKRLMRLAIQIIAFPFFLGWQLLIFLFSSWTTTRDSKAAIWGLIPLIGFFVVGALAISGDFFENRRIKGSNQLEIVNAMAVNDHEKAILHSRRLQNISQGDPEKFVHAQTLIAAGMEENGNALIELIAPSDRPGYIPAHYYQAQKLFESDKQSPERNAKLELAKKHLEWIEEKAVESAKIDSVTAAAMNARGLMPIIMFEQNDTENAANRAMQISNVQPNVVPQLVEYLFDSGQPEMARRHIARGIECLDTMESQNPTVINKPNYWQLRHQIRMLNNEYDVINRELLEGLQVVNNPYTRRIISQLLSKVRYDYAGEFKLLAGEDMVRRRVKFLCLALEASPQNLEAQEALVELIAYPPSEDVRRWCEQEIRDELPTHSKHLFLGILDAIRGLPGTAEKQLVLALNANVLSAQVAASFCRVMGQKDNRKSAAFDLTEVIISAWEGPPFLFKVRGEMALAMGRVDEALTDFNYYERFTKNDIPLYELIEECYERLNQPEKAVVTRQKIDELLERQAEEIELLKQSFGESSGN